MTESTATQVTICLPRTPPAGGPVRRFVRAHLPELPVHRIFEPVGPPLLWRTPPGAPVRSEGGHGSDSARKTGPDRAPRTVSSPSGPLPGAETRTPDHHRHWRQDSRARARSRGRKTGSQPNEPDSEPKPLNPPPAVEARSRCPFGARHRRKRWLRRGRAQPGQSAASARTVR